MKKHTWDVAARRLSRFAFFEPAPLLDSFCVFFLQTNQKPDYRLHSGRLPAAASACPPLHGNQRALD